MAKTLAGRALLVGTIGALVAGFPPTAAPARCPVVNFSIPEGSSEMIMPNMSDYHSALLFSKVNQSSSSSCQRILNIKNCTLNSYLSQYTAHFSISECGLKVMNASRFLIGEYHLSYQLSEDCLQRISLDVTASAFKRARYGVLVAVPLVVVVVVVVMLIACC
ncbi:uncharacterized protein LOC143831512 [Paroedura picta]|uniref:uncharacterized protein LOC143831512 n=1 Tax=Paroedura picta TaxID=143630 RepID=UPI00405669E1